MSAGALKDDLVVHQLVDKQPVGFDVAFAAAFVVADQRMIALALRQWFFVMSVLRMVFNFSMSLPRRSASRRSRSN